MQNTGLSVQKNILWNSAGSIIALGCNWLMTIMVVRLSNGYDSAGVLALAMTIGNIFTPFATYKMRTYQISDVDNEYSAGEYFTFRVVTTSLALAGCIVYAVATCQQSAICSIVLFLLYKCIQMLCMAWIRSIDEWTISAFLLRPEVFWVCLLFAAFFA